MHLFFFANETTFAILGTHLWPLSVYVTCSKTGSRDNQEQTRNNSQNGELPKWGVTKLGSYQRQIKKKHISRHRRISFKGIAYIALA